MLEKKKRIITQKNEAVQKKRSTSKLIRRSERLKKKSMASKLKKHTKMESSLSKLEELSTESSSSCKEKDKKSTYIQPSLKNSGLCECLSFLTTLMDSIFYKDFRHVLFDPSKSQNCVKGIAESNNYLSKFTISYLAKIEMLQILKDKLLKHKWGDAVLILEGYSWIDSIRSNRTLNRPEEITHSEILLRAGRESLMNHPLSCSNDAILRSHSRSLRFYQSYLDQSHIALEDGFCHFANHDYEAAKQQLSAYDIPDKSCYVKEKIRKMALPWSKIVEGYIGLTDYCMWKQNLVYSKNATFQDIAESSSNAEKLASLAEGAMKHFQPLTKQKGTWDIFILKHIEIMLHCHKLDILRNDLSLYSKHHLKNPNAHRYLYWFLNCYVNQNDTAAQKLKVLALQRLHRVSPADILMVDFHKLLLTLAINKVTKFYKSSKDSQNLMIVHEIKALSLFNESFEVLMGLLDHPFHSRSIAPWRCLAESFIRTKKCLNDALFSELTDQLWVSSGRATWWPYLHFSVKQAHELSSSVTDFIEAKKFVAMTFLGADSVFLNAIQPDMQDN